MMIGVDDVGPAEALREALAHLYEPTVLRELPLAGRLVEQGRLRSPDGLYDLLLTSIDRLKPPDGAPPQSHGWRCYRYLSQRYVECETNEAIAREFGVSARHAARLHLDALDALARLLLPGCPSSVGSEYRRERLSGDSAHQPPRERASALEAELAAVGRRPPEGMVDVADVAQSIGDTLSQVTAQHGVGVDLRFPEGLPPVRVNRVCLRQVILNVLLYLIQSIGEGSVLVKCQTSGDSVIVVLQAQSGHPVGNTGTPEREGATAVLDAAKELARLQRITLVEDEAGPLAFRLRLPIGVTRTVLLVDDNPDVGDLFRRMLAKEPYHLTHCRTADRALQLAHASPPDVIVMDIVLPSTDGWELLADLRRDPRTAAIPVVVCSVLPDREVAMSLRVADFVAKPVSRRVLVEALDRIFERS